MTILAYHSVSTRKHPLAVAPDEFARQLDRLAKCRLLSLREYARRVSNGVSTRNCIALTFDDGYRDFAEVVVPMLSERRYPATTFVAPGLVGGSLEVDDAGTGVDRRWVLMDWNEIRAVSAAGMEVASHSMTHCDLTRTGDSELKDEVAVSKQALEDRLGETVDGFCYPAGWYDERVVHAVEDAGYRWAVVTPRTGGRPHGEFTLPRVGIYHHDDARRFRLKLTRTGRVLGRGRRLFRNHQ
jgi:peptidoglycan/xylan/chitin deacetylase (PgdA/CDA1 family)